MASENDVRAGGAYIEIGAILDPLAKALDKAAKFAKAKLQPVADKLRDLGRGALEFGTKMAAAGAALAAPLVAAVKAAGDFAEVESKFDAVFKELASENKEWADSFRKEVGRSRAEIFAFMAELQDVFVPLGFDRGQAAAMSRELTKLSVDLASFNNRADADVLADLLTGIVGNTEALRKYGIVILESTVKQKALESGMNPKALSEQQKAFLRMQLILQSTTDAQGDAVRTAGSFNNQLKALKAVVSDTAIEVGQHLLPMITPLIAEIRSGVAWVAAFARENKHLITVWAGVAVAITAIGVAIAGVGVALSVAGAALNGLITLFVFAARVAVMTFLNPTFVAISLVVGGIAAIGASLLAVLDVVGVANTGFGDLFNAIRIGGTGLGTWMAGLAIQLEKAWNIFVLNVQNLMDALWAGIKIVGRGALNFLLFIPEKIVQAFGWMIGQIENRLNDLIQIYNNFAESINLSPIELQFGAGKEAIDGARKYIADIRKALSDENARSNRASIIRQEEREKEADSRNRDLERRQQNLFKKDPQNNSGLLGFDSEKARKGITTLAENAKNIVGDVLKNLLGSLGITIPESAIASIKNAIDESITPPGGLSGAKTKGEIVGTFTGGLGNALAANGVLGKSLDVQKKMLETLTSIDRKAGRGATFG